MESKKEVDIITVENSGSQHTLMKRGKEVGSRQQSHLGESTKE